MPMTSYLYFFDAAMLGALSCVIYQSSTIGRSLMSLQDQVDALTAQVAKITAEVTAKQDALLAHLADVEAQLAAAGAAEDVDLSALKTAIQNLDDINPDAVVEPPVEVVVDEQPADETPVA